MPAGSIIIDLLMRTGSFETDSKRAEKRLREMERTAKQAGAAIGTAFVVATTVVAGLTKHAIDQADAMRDLSIRVGESTETLSAYSYMASQTGTDVEALGKGLKILAKNAADAINPTSEQAKVFDALGIKVTDTDGKLRKLSALLPEIADRFKVMEDGTTKAALSQALFGRAGLEMTEFLNQGSEGMAAFAKKAQDLGIIIDGETATAADNFNDTLGDLKAQAAGFGLTVARELLPQLQEAASDLSDLAMQGNLAADVASVLGASFSAAAGLLSAYEKTVRLVTLAMENYMTVSSSVLEIQKNLMTLGFADGTVSGAVERIRQQKAASDKEMAEILAGPQKPAVRLVFAGQDPDPEGLFAQSPEEAALRKRNQSLEARVAAALSNPTIPSARKAGGSGKSEAEREAEQLQRAYDSLRTSQLEQIALFGKTGEAVKVRYATEHGELVGLTAAQKESLITGAERLDQMREESDLQAELDEIDRQRTEAIQRVTSALDEQLQIVGMSADEQEIWNNLKWAGVEADSAWGQQIIESTRQLQEQRDAMNDQIEAMDSLRDAGSDFLHDIKEGKNVWDSLGNAIDKVADKLFDLAAENLMDQIFGKQGDPAGGSTGGFFSGLLGMFFGGARAEGGDVLSGRGYLVGEDGPEMFVPRTAGAILPASVTAGMGGSSFQQSNNFYYAAPPDPRTQQQTAARVGFETRRATSRNS